MSDKEITLYKFTNQKESPYLDTHLAMFYSGAFRNLIGIMDAKKVNDAGEEEPVLLLVGVANENGGIQCYPLAEVIPSEKANDYLQPDGNGGYSRPESQECKAT